MNIKKLILLLLVICFALFTRVYWSLYGGNIIGDEPFSYSISTPSNINDNGEIFKQRWDNFRLNENKAYKGQYLKEIFFKPQTEAIGKDLKMMYISTNDDGHSNFYYSLFRIYNNNLDNLDPNFLKIWGIFFNIILCLFAMVVMLKLLRAILKDDKHIPLAMLICFLNAGAISCTMLVREYQLQMIFFILVSYIFTKIYNSINSEEKLHSYLTLLLYSLSLALFALSGYYSEIYTIILGGILLYKAYKYKRNDWIYALITIYLGHFILAKILYLGFFNFIGSQDFPQEPFNLTRIWNRFCKNTYFLYKSVFYFPIIVLGIIGIGSYLKKNNSFKGTQCNLLLLLSFLSLIWSFIIIYIGHLDYIRYVMAGYPIIALAIVWLIVNLDSKIWSLFFGTIMILYATPLTLYYLPKAIGSKVYYVHLNFNHMNDLIKSPIPIYLKNDTDFPVYATTEVILYTSDDADVQIVSDMNYFTSKENPNDKFIVITRIPEDYDTKKSKEDVHKKIDFQKLEDYCPNSGWHCFPVTKKTYYKIEKLYEKTKEKND